MENLLKSIALSLKTKNWPAAIFMTLSIPDICAALESDNGKTSKKKYIKWFDKYLAETYKKRIGARKKEHTFLTGNDMYAFRCSMLHEFSDDTKSQDSKDKIGKFRMTISSGHLNYNCDVTPEEIIDGDELHINIPCFCIEVCDAAKKWMQSNPSLLVNTKTAYILDFSDNNT